MIELSTRERPTLQRLWGASLRQSAGNAERHSPAELEESASILWRDASVAPRFWVCLTRATYGGTSLKRRRTPLGPYRRPMTRVLGGSSGGGRFLMGEVPLFFSCLQSRFAVRIRQLSSRNETGLTNLAIAYTGVSGSKETAPPPRTLVGP